jgi:hypothetical protein
MALDTTIRTTKSKLKTIKVEIKLNFIFPLRYLNKNKKVKGKMR